MKLDGKIAYLENEDHRQNTSFDSMGTDQIFMTYVENEMKEESDSVNQNHILIDQEINQIRQNLRLPTNETEEDHDENQNVYMVKEFEYHGNKVEDDGEHAGGKSVFNPLSRKLAVMEYDSHADIAEAKHINSCQGFLSSPDLVFVKKDGNSEFGCYGSISHSEYENASQKLLNVSILKSFLCTPVKLIS
jgi:hypothetical protein